MKQEHQNILFTVLGIAALVALFFYLKNKFGFGFGGSGDGSGGAGILPSIEKAINQAENVGERIINGALAHKEPIGLGKTDTIKSWVATLKAVDGRCSLYTTKFAKDPIIAEQLGAVNALPEKTFRAVVGQWLVDSGYTSVTKSYIFNTMDRDPETADFVNRALVKI